MVVRSAGTRLPDEKRRLIIKLAAQGCSYRQIADQAQVAQGSVGRVVRPLGGVIRAELVEVPACRLSLDDRIEIKLGLERGETVRGDWCSDWSASFGGVSRDQGCSSGVVTAIGRPRRIALAVQRWKRHKDTKLALNPVLCQRVVDGLERLWSPQQIARRLRAEFGDDRACACRTRRSISRCTCRDAASCAGSWRMSAHRPRSAPAPRRARDATRSGSRTW